MIGQDPEHGGGRGHLVCLDASGQGDITSAGVIWSYKGIQRSLSTPSIDPESGLLFVGDYAGFIHCLDADTGEVYWVYDMMALMWSSTLVADGKVYVGNAEGDFLVLPARRDFRPKRDQTIFETNLGAPIYCTPVVANGILYVATQQHLYAIGGTPALAGKE